MPMYSAKAVADDASERERGIQRSRPDLSSTAVSKRGNGHHRGKMLFKFPHGPWQMPG